MNNKILDQVNTYYTDKINEHGVTPKGVDWNSNESQELRFAQLSNVINTSNKFSLLDFGCGYGALLPYLYDRYNNNLEYHGYDISEEMINNAKKANSSQKANWYTNLPANKKFDFIIASGIFNVRLENSEMAWKDYVINTLQIINQKAEQGFSFNILTSYSDKEFMKDYLFYANPLEIFDYCKLNFSKYVTLLHDYPLYEFTIIVRK
jgi:cyclopropane fatty-acyl-phospholipid synthase-like methyltransferase